MLYTASYFEPKNHHGKLISISRSRPKNFHQLPTLDFFAPSQDLLNFWKDRSKAQPKDLAKYWEEYQDGFFQLLDDRFERIDEWISKLNTRDYTLLCWEKAGDYCHRNDVGELLAARCDELWGGFDVVVTPQERAWNSPEFEVCGDDGSKVIWMWVDKPTNSSAWKMTTRWGTKTLQIKEFTRGNKSEEPAPKNQAQDPFVNLHGHTECSDGLMSAQEYLERVDACGQSAAAITDHGTMAGAAEFLLEAKKRNIKGIVGNELYLRVPELIKYLKESNLQGDYKVKEKFHQLAIALNPVGYRNLAKLTTLANAINDKKVISFEQLEDCQEGLIVTSGCVAGVIPQLVLTNHQQMAWEWARKYQQIWGDRFYIELQDHVSAMYVELNKTLVEIAQNLNIKCIITADSHYLTKNDYLSHSIFQAIKWGKTLNDPNRTPYDTDLFLGSSEDFKKRFHYLPAGVVEEAIANTGFIADQVTDYKIFRKPTAPKFPIPDGYPDNNAYLAALSATSLTNRFPNGCSEEYRDRLEFELKTIAQMGFSDYFLVVWDLVKFARDNNIPVGAGRGSAAGSLVTYVLGITNIDPIHHGLLFERFLNPERVSMPDIDLDFCPERRKEIIGYLMQKYGEDRVAQISTPNTMKSKAVLQDVGRVLEIAPKERDELCKLIPSSRGKVTSLHDMLEKPLEEFKSSDRTLVEQFRSKYQTELKVKDWIDKAMPLEGKRRTTGVHAAAVVIGDVPIAQLAPLRKDKDSGVVATEYAMAEIEELGFIKMDILGIANLTLLQNAVDLVREDFGVEIDVDALPWHDPKLFELFAKGETDGIFQFESDGMKQLLTKLKPSVFEDLVAANALFRPGPIDSGMVDRFIEGKHGGQVNYPATCAEPVLKPTYGEAIYQEQLMKLAQEIAGFTLGQADLLRRACGKKKLSEMVKHEALFTDGVLSQGHSQKLASELWQILLNSAEYCFNRSHALAYTLLAWRCAYFRVYYPLQFMAALISINADKSEKIKQYLLIASKLSIQILPPDINLSSGEFKTHNGCILYGFKGIDGMGESAIAAILSARNEKPFESLADFCSRVALSCSCIESLIKVGAFDKLISNRASAVATLPAIHQWAADKRKKDKKSCEDQLSLFAADPFITPAPKIGTRAEYSSIELLEFEQAVLGVYLSGHPLDSLPEGKPLSLLKNRMKAKVSIQVMNCHPKESRNGIFANLELEDKWGNRLKGVCWADEYLQYSYAIEKGSFVHLDGRVTEWNGQLQYAISKVL